MFSLSFDDLLYKEVNLSIPHLDVTENLDEIE